MPKLRLTHKKISGLKPKEKTVNYYDSVESGLILRVTKTGHKSFSYNYRIHGTTRRYTIGTYSGVSLADARNKVTQIKGQLAEGKDPQAEKIKRKTELKPKKFTDLIDDYKAKRLPELRESTQKFYKHIIDKELVPNFGNQSVNSITSKQIRDLLDNKAYEQGHSVMANRIRARLNTIFNFGVSRGYTESNPVKSTPTYDEGKTKAGRAYSEDELKKLWVFFSGLQPATGGSLKMMLLTGQRKTETLRMKWESIEDSIWTIPPEIAKNKQSHQVPLSGMAMSVLDSLRQITGDSEYVFASPKDSTKPTRSLSRAIQNTKKYSGVCDFKPHDLRRTFTTHLQRLNVSQQITGKLLNHKEAGMENSVTAIYNRHNYYEKKAEAMKKYGEFIETIIDGLGS